MSYARGSRAWGECQRCGERLLLNRMVGDGYVKGLRVCPPCYDPPHPQERPIALHDPQALYRPAPELSVPDNEGVAATDVSTVIPS